MPVINASDQDAIVIPAHEIQIETMRASGAGGQHVNKTESAVRVRHLPTGITVRVSADRSQLNNRRQAMLLLEAKLRQRQQQLQCGFV